MNRPSLAVLLALAAGCATGHAADRGDASQLKADPSQLRADKAQLKPARTEFELGGSYESLTNNYSDWSSLYFDAVHQFGDRQTLLGGVRETRRYGLTDAEAYGGLYFPMGATWTGLVEGSLSTHNVLAKYALGGHVLKTLPHGWGLGLGLRYSDYSASSANVASAIVERYWGNFRGAYTLYSGRPEGGPSGASHRFQVTYYYGDRSFAGLSYTTGREIENDPTRGVLTSDVRDWTLSGRHWLAPNWALTYDVIAHEQGSTYSRYGVRLGVRHGF